MCWGHCIWRPLRCDIISWLHFVLIKGNDLPLALNARVQSFRFGSEIAYVGATILSVCKGVNKILVGGKQKGKKKKKC